jgi:hypothetical protein
VSHTYQFFSDSSSTSLTARDYVSHPYKTERKNEIILLSSLNFGVLESSGNIIFSVKSRELETRGEISDLLLNT